VIQGVRPKVYGQGVNVRDWIHVDDHNDAVLTILERGRRGQTYLIGADGEADNLTVVRLLLEIMDRPTDWFELVGERPGHDLRYAIDSAKLRAETGWAPRYRDLRDGLVQTVAWYREHEDWWQADKSLAEERYARLGR
jgi:dTDP-glucose 4,6-dehydratase